jgi:hypothetical protein
MPENLHLVASIIGLVAAIITATVSLIRYLVKLLIAIGGIRKELHELNETMQKSFSSTKRDIRALQKKVKSHDDILKVRLVK